MATMECTDTLYDILQISPSATAEDIKRAYQTLILQTHPDKQVAGGGDSKDAFIQIDEAYKVLRDPEERKKYDAEMAQTRFDEEFIVHESLSIKEFVKDETTGAYSHPCRCGGFYEVPPDEEGDEEMDCYLACEECSLVIHVHR